MKKQLTILSALVAAAVSSFYFAGCTTEETVSSAGLATGLMANSKNASTVMLRWTRDANDNGTDRVIVRNSTGIIVDSSQAVSGTGASATVSLPSTGAPFTFEVRNDAGTSAQLTWEGATRTSTVKVFEKAAPSSLGFSALQLNGAGGSAQAISLTGANLSTTVDFILEDVGGDLALESADAFDASYRKASMSDTAIYVVGGLDMNFLSKDLSMFTYETGGASTTLAASDATNYTTKGSKIKLVKTADSHYARIEIVPDASTGKLFSTTGGYRYVTLNVSYQSRSNEPYASRPRPNLPPAGYGNPRHITQ